MFVLLDVEWIETAPTTQHITQMSALRVDEHWDGDTWFEAVICPPDRSLCSQPHMALSGYSQTDFENGESIEDAMRCLSLWLLESDTLCLWSADAKQVFAAAWQRVFCAPISHLMVSVNHKVQKFVKRKNITAGNLYTISSALGLPLLSPQHRSTNDVVTMQRLLQKLEFSQDRIIQRPLSKPAVQERNQRMMLSSEFLYFYTHDSKIFHARNCRAIRNVLHLEGCVKYKTASKRRRPCKICNPQPDVNRLPPPPVTPHVPTDSELKSAMHNSEIVRARMLGGGTVEIKRGNLVGCCHYYIHPGKMTKEHLTRHDCVKKQCPFFEKYEDSGYWQNQKQKKKSKEGIKRQRRMEKAKAAALAEALQTAKEKFQACADATQSPMDIIRVEMPKAGEYIIFYVSDYPFADGNRFPEFLQSAHRQCPCRHIKLRHIKDVDGHFVTREEFQVRKPGWSK